MTKATTRHHTEPPESNSLIANHFYIILSISYALFSQTLTKHLHSLLPTHAISPVSPIPQITLWWLQTLKVMQLVSYEIMKKGDTKWQDLIHMKFTSLELIGCLTITILAISSRLYADQCKWQYKTEGEMKFQFYKHLAIQALL